MEQFISDIERYCAAHGISPQKLLRDAVNASWRQWQDWRDGKSSPTLRVADRIREHMKVSSDRACQPSNHGGGV